MKICMPTLGNSGLSEPVHNHFGSAKFFAVYDVDSEKLDFVSNGNEHHEHGMCQPLVAIASLGINAVLTQGMGSRAIGLLNQGGIKVYVLEGETITDAINKFKSNELIEMTPESGCTGHGCH
ncbi:NifB/NifX family molybdenum-iron cluster-binding protein [Candidatus Woesearchaeota archaeon]|nr:NifB/NifX family molybdenum-iron cluster-binding protein [Candidatus Woesearchaeota archaeon]